MRLEVESKGINCLVHFTRIENLPTILTHGLIPRLNLEQNWKNIVYNDSFRHDGRKRANCLSISHPNYKMFYKLRCSEPDQVWAVIGFKPSVMWELPCLFTYENAASERMSRASDQELSNIDAFRNMFANLTGMPSRTDMCLRDFETTNPQAEVLATCTIPPEYILGVAFQSPNYLQHFGQGLANYGFSLISHPNFFESRHDWRYWSGN